MNDDHVKGKVDELKGDIKQRIGGATKDRSLEAEGAVDEGKGKLRQGLGSAKEKIKDALHKDKDEPERR